MALTHKAAAAVSLGTYSYSAWESTATLRLLGSERGALAPMGEGGEGGYHCCHAHSLFVSKNWPSA